MRAEVYFTLGTKMLTAMEAVAPGREVCERVSIPSAVMFDLWANRKMYEVLETSNTQILNREFVSYTMGFDKLSEAVGVLTNPSVTQKEQNDAEIRVASVRNIGMSKDGEMDHFMVVTLTGTGDANPVVMLLGVPKGEKDKLIVDERNRKIIKPGVATEAVIINRFQPTNAYPDPAMEITVAKVHTKAGRFSDRRNMIYHVHPGNVSSMPGMEDESIRILGNFGMSRFETDNDIVDFTIEHLTHEVVVGRENPWVPIVDEQILGSLPVWQ